MRCAHSLLRHLFRRQPAVSLLILASAAQAVLPTSAQEAEADAQLETVIVSAIGAPREAGELISHVDALTADDLQRVLRGSLGDTLDVEPGVSSTSFGQGASRPVLRGLGAERVLVLTNGLGAIDASAASPDHQVAADGIDAERVEIVRGPAALAYGGQAIGGIVNVIDGLTYQRAEESGLSGRGFATVESVNEGIEGGARFRAVSPDWTLVASASARDFGDYEIPGAAESAVQLAREGETAEDSGTLANSFVKTSSQALGLSHTFENGFFGLALHGQQSEYGLPGGAHEDEEGAEAEAPFIDLEQTRIDLRGGLTFNGGWLTGVKASAAFADYQHTEFEAVGEPGTVFESDGSESRLEAAHEFGSVEGVAGVQYADVSLAAEGDEAFITATDTERLALFLFERFETGNDWSFEGGLRFESLTYKNANAGKRDFDLLAASFGAHRHIGNWFYGAQLAWSERAPSPTELFANGPHLATRQFEIGDPSAQKEKGLSAEASLRFEGERFQASLNAFHSGFTGFLYLSPTGDEEDGLPFFAIQHQDADYTGAELTLTWQPVFSLVGGALEFESALEMVEANFADGGDVPLVPPLTLRLEGAVDWTWMRAALSATFAAEQDVPGEGFLPVERYEVFDADFEVPLKLASSAKSALFLQVRNIGDVEVRYATSVLRDLAPQPGRSLRAGVRLGF